MTTGIEDLYSYLRETGEEFKPEWAGGHDETVQKEFDVFLQSGKTAEQFYRESQTLLYHLIWFGEDQWKIPYRRIIRENFAPPASLLEFGCGVGTDGIQFAESGYKVAFTDYPSECTKFLEWRLKLHEINAQFYPFDEYRDKADLVFAFDVIERVPDPKVLLQTIERLGKCVAVNFLTNAGNAIDGKEHLYYYHDPQELVDWVKGHSEIIQERDFNYARFLVYKPSEQVVLSERKAKRHIPVTIAPEYSGKEQM